MRALLLIATLVSTVALAQSPRETPPPSAAASDLPRRMCEALAGGERERCFAELDARATPEDDKVAPRGGSPRNCDRLLGPERDLCLKSGGSVKAGSGQTRP
jgi:hypothetical protein